MDDILRFDGAVKRSPVLERWLDEQKPELGALARTWFEKMRGCGKDVREVMHDGCANACVADAPFAYVNIFKAHINVGFFYGATLKDSAGLLVGTGKRMRHVKLKPGAAINETALGVLIEAAYADMRKRLKTG